MDTKTNALCIVIVFNCSMICGSSPSNISVVVGSSVTLRCDSTHSICSNGNEHGWFKYQGSSFHVLSRCDVVLEAASPRMTVSVEGNSYRLRIADSQPEDAGNYICFSTLRWTFSDSVTLDVTETTQQRSANGTPTFHEVIDRPTVPFGGSGTTDGATAQRPETSSSYLEMLTLTTTQKSYAGETSPEQPAGTSRHPEGTPRRRTTKQGSFWRSAEVTVPVEPASSTGMSLAITNNSALARTTSSGRTQAEPSTTGAVLTPMEIDFNHTGTGIDCNQEIQHGNGTNSGIHSISTAEPPVVWIISCAVLILSNVASAAIAIKYRCKTTSRPGNLIDIWMTTQRRPRDPDEHQGELDECRRKPNTPDWNISGKLEGYEEVNISEDCTYAELKLELPTTSSVNLHTFINRNT